MADKESAQIGNPVGEELLPLPPLPGQEEQPDDQGKEEGDARRRMARAIRKKQGKKRSYLQQVLDRVKTKR